MKSVILFLAGLGLVGACGPRSGGDTKPQPPPAQVARPRPRARPVRPARAVDTPAEAAFKAWRSGAVIKAGELAQKCVDNPTDGLRCRQLALAVAHVRGQHERVFKIFIAMKTIPTKPPHPAKAAMDSLVHLGRYAEALMIASRGRPRSFLTTRMNLLYKKPLKVKLTGVTTVPFVKGGMLDAFFPGIKATINRKRVTARLDTGGTFLVMSPADAKRLNIKTICGGVGQHAFWKSKVCVGTADRFVIGAAVLRNVPVSTMSTLKAGTIIFGTNVLEQFLATMDYPAGRLILSKRGQPTQRQAHLKMLKSPSVTVPFYMWGDHFMFAHGRMGNHRNLVFFVDSGLVAITMRKGKLRQAGFTTSAEGFKRLGVLPAGAKGPFHFFPGNVGLGKLIQKGILVYRNPKTWKKLSFGGIRVDGLISHAWLTRYQWTIDFDKYEYRFGL